MGKSWFLLAFLLCQVLQNEAGFSFSAGYGIDLGITKLNPGINPGIENPNPTPAQIFPPAPNPTTGSDQETPVLNAGSETNPNPAPISNPTTNSDQKTPIPDENSAYSALQAWKSAITDDPLKILDNWVGPDVCSYRGVFCDDESAGRGSSSPIVASIDLNHGNLQGKLVKELSFFKNMSVFHLNSNRFTGTIPDSFEQLSCLEELDLSNNQFSGPFPPVALCIPNLAYLDLRFNSFAGPIPESLFNKKLDAVFLNNNNFDGLIPQTLANAAASVMNFANNKLTGSLPTSFGELGCNIREIVFLNNQLTGCMPPVFGLFPDLEVFDVSQNSLTGRIPDTLSQLKKIQVLNLGNNKFSGRMPDFCAIKSLVNLTVSNNFFSGFAPDCSKLLKSNLGFNFSFNCVPGTIWGTPQSRCSLSPGGSLNCLRLPIPQPLACAVHDLTSGIL